MFDFTDKAFNQMSFTIKMPIDRSLQAFVNARRNNGTRARLFNRFDECL